MIKKKYFYVTISVIMSLSFVYMAWAAVSGESLLNIQNSTSSGSLLSPVRVKDAGNISDNQTSGILPSGLMGYNGTNWDKIRTSNGKLFINMSSSFGNSTVKSNQGNPNTNTNGWPVKITDGTNILGITTNPISVSTIPIATIIATRQRSIGSAKFPLITSNINRKEVLIQNIGGTDVYCGGTFVTYTSGFKIPANGGGYVDDKFTGTYWCITQSGTTTMTYREVR